MQLKIVKISSLKPHIRNPNTHPAEQIQELENSLDEFDQVKNIVVWQGQVIAGCGLLEAAKKQGRDVIEVQDISDWPEEKALKFMIADNRLPELAIMDDDLLSGLLADFDEPLDIPGVDESFLDELDIKENQLSNNQEIENNYAEQFGVIVICENENHQEEVYSFLNKEGYKVKVVNT